jgi:hypothetical protein
MEPDYKSIDPEERTYKFLAIFSFIIGILSLCAGLVPICGVGNGMIGIVTGIFGRKSERRKLANAGILISVLGIIISIIYAILVANAKG